MKLQSEHPSEILIPTSDILYVWIAHIIRPSHFKEDCEKHFGKKNLFPVFNFNDPLIENLKEKLLLKTQFLFESTYNLPYLPKKFKNDSVLCIILFCFYFILLIFIY